MVVVSVARKRSAYSEFKICQFVIVDEVLSKAVTTWKNHKSSCVVIERQESCFLCLVQRRCGR